MKTKNYKVIPNLPEPSEGFFKDLEDFETIKGKAKGAEPGEYKLSKKFSITKLVVVSGVLLLMVVLFYLWFGVKGKTEVIGLEVELYRNVPLKEIEPPFETFEIFSGNGDTLFTKGGSIIILPPCKFLNEQQNEVSGKVELSFRQWNNAAEMALGGITLNYTSKGNTTLFESNGMFEIYATQKSQKLQIQPDCPCKVLLATNSLDTRFDNYFLDTVQKQWQYLGPMQVENIFQEKEGEMSLGAPVPPAAPTEFIMQEEVPLPPKTLPPAPKEDNPTLPDFKIVANENDFPELALYKGVLFEVEPKEAERSVPLFAKTWSNIDLVTIKSGLLYKVRMQKMNRTGAVIVSDSILVHPVIPDENYDEALARYRQLEKDYEKELGQQKRKIALQKERDRKWQDSLERLVEQLDKVPTNRQGFNIESNGHQINYGNLRASFSVATFGVYNSDFPIPIPSKTLIAKVKSKNNLYYSHLYQVIPAINSFMVNYSIANQSKEGVLFNINPYYSEREKWFIVLDEHSIAVWESTYLQKNQFESTIYLKVEDAKIYRDLKSPNDAVTVLLK